MWRSISALASSFARSVLTLMLLYTVIVIDKTTLYLKMLK